MDEVIQNTEEYVGKKVEVVLNNPQGHQKSYRGTVLSTDSIGIKLEITGRTKVYNNFYTWNSVREIQYLVKNSDDEEKAAG